MQENENVNEQEQVKTENQEPAEGPGNPLKGVSAPSVPNPAPKPPVNPPAK